MTGIERHWQEESDRETEVKQKRLMLLEAEVAKLRWELYPQAMSQLGQQNAAMGGNALGYLLGGLGAAGSYGSNN